jgi:PilZ domain
MQERRGHMRDKVLLGAVAEIREIGSTVDCVVRNLSDNGACVEFKTSVNLPDQMKLMIKRRGAPISPGWSGSRPTGSASPSAPW